MRIECLSRDEAKDVMCSIANNNVLHIEEIWCYNYFNEKFGIHIGEFYSDDDDLDDYAKNVIGLYNWKVKD